MSDNKLIQNSPKLPDDQKAYNTVRCYIIAAQKQVYSAVSSAMVTAYWNIGKLIYEACGENDRAAYGKHLCSFIR